MSATVNKLFWTKKENCCIDEFKFSEQGYTLNYFNLDNPFTIKSKSYQTLNTGVVLVSCEALSLIIQPLVGQPITQFLILSPHKKQELTLNIFNYDSVKLSVEHNIKLANILIIKYYQYINLFEVSNKQLENIP